MAFVSAIALVWFLIQVCLQPTEGAGTLGTRADTPLEIEVLVIADYSAFNKWYQLLDSSLPQATRVNYAKQNLTTWLGAMIHSANVVYKRLESDGIFISIKMVDLIIQTTVADSPWTETTKFMVNETYMIDPDVVHPLLEQRSIELQKTIPHDHVMLFTRYTLIHGRKGTTRLAGNAYLGAECKANSQSIVKDSEDSYTAQTIAHELGHSLGCEHDGTNNTCKVGAGYCMEADYVMHNANKWIFSTCSINYIKQFLARINQQHRNCLARIDDNHANSALGIASQKWTGLLYSHDQQCVIAEGKGSYLCRQTYKGNFTDLCLNMWCYKPDTGECSSGGDAGDKTPCANRHSCLSGRCVVDSTSLAITDEKCVAGDRAGIVYKHKTCQQIVSTSPNDCLRSDVKALCCDSCKHAKTIAVQVDEQCKADFGSDSYMCRGSSRYSATFSILCDTLFCRNLSTENNCNAVTAYDKTPCGNRKWCMDGKCVSDPSAPVVLDSCPMGDQVNDPGVSYNNYTCEQIRQHNRNYACYNNYTQKACCQTCADIKRNTHGCEFGDKHADCFTLITSKVDSHYCYQGQNAQTCCESCNKYKNASHVGCEYGDKSTDCVTLVKSQADSPNCYAGHNADICCEACGKLYDAARVGCEYGDKLNGCSPSRCGTLTAESRKGCCLSCHSSAIIG